MLHDDSGAFNPMYMNFVEATHARIQGYHGSSALFRGAGWPYEEVRVDDNMA